MGRPTGVINVGVVPICDEGCNALAESREGEEDTTAHVGLFEAADLMALGM